jgi:hypothetical protein
MSKQINVSKDFLYLLKDETNNGILHASNSHDAAIAMTLFSPRVSMIPLETHKPWLKDNLKTANYRNKSIFLKWDPKMGQRFVSPLEKQEITPEYIAYRREIAMRARYQEMLITHCNISSAANCSETPLLEKYASTIINELSKCSIEQNIFTPAIINYALISKIDTATAVNELQLHIDNMAQARLKNLAVYIKFRNELNRAELEDQSSIINLAISAIYRPQH